MLPDARGAEGSGDERHAEYPAHRQRHAMLTVLEEIVLLTVDEKTGKLRSPRNYATAHALAGALFFDLALAKKIDTDTECIQLIDATPSGNAVTDYFLNQIAERKDLSTV